MDESTRCSPSARKSGLSSLFHRRSPRRITMTKPGARTTGPPQFKTTNKPKPNAAGSPSIVTFAADK